MSAHPIPPGSLAFAPMEGITDEGYRLAVARLYPEWDSFSTDFLRAPAKGFFSETFVRHHYGERVLADPLAKAKTTFQIMATPATQTLGLVEQVQALEVERLDLNLGCPSRTVNNHGGGAVLLASPQDLLAVVRPIRRAFQGLFTVKMRIGFRDDALFLDNLRLLEAEGVDAITLHARTRDQLYKGIADWNYVRVAAKTVRVPVIGNGDIWTPADVARILDETGCHSVMCGRGAMKTPWLAREFALWKAGLRHSKEEDLQLRRMEVRRYYGELRATYAPYYPAGAAGDAMMLKRFKALCRYLFEDYPQGERIRSAFLRADGLNLFLELLEQFSEGKLALPEVQEDVGGAPQDGQQDIAAS